MAYELAAAGITGGAGLAGTIVNNLFARNQNAKQRAWAERQAQLQRNYELAMYQKERRDNSPAEQLRLMQEAGVNPSAFAPSFQPASAGAGQMTPMPPQEPYHIDTSFVGESIGNFLAAKQAQLDIQSKKEDVTAKQLANDEKFQEVQAKKEKYTLDGADLSEDAPWINSDAETFTNRYLDNVTVTASRKYNQWEEDRYQHNLATKQAVETLDHLRKENKVYSAQMPALEKMPAQQLASLIKDIEMKGYQNWTAAKEKEFRETYGFDPKSSSWFSILMQLVLTNPQALENVASALEKFGDVAFGTLFKRITPETLIKGSPVAWLAKNLYDKMIKDTKEK